MEIQAAITILFDDNGLNIEVEDRISGQMFLKIRLNQKQTCQALSRLAYTHCQKAEVFYLERIGKKMEMADLQFQMPPGSAEYGDGRKEAAAKEALRVAPKGWTPSTYFGSQDSYFYKDGELWARTTIRRWVENKEAQ